MQDKFLELVIKTIEENCGLHDICMDALRDSGVYACLDPGYNSALYYNRRALRMWPISFMAKNKDQVLCIQQLNTICDYLQKLKKYPSGDVFTWKDATVANYPSKVGRQEDGQYIYSCTINMQVYF